MDSKYIIGKIKQLKNPFAFAGTEVISKGINWLIPFILFFISINKPSIYGILAVIIAFEHIARTVLDLGQRRIIFRFYNPNNEYNNQFLSITFSIWLLTTTIIIFAFCLLLKVLGLKTFFQIPTNIYFYLFIVSFIPIIIASFITSYYRITKQIIRYSKFNLTTNITRIILIVSLSFFFDNVVNGYLLGTTLSYIIVVIINLKIFREFEYRFVIEKKVIIRNLKYGYPLVLQQLVSNIGPNIDKFILTEFVPLSTIGTYNFIVTLTSAFVFLTGILTSYFEPILFRCRDNNAKFLSINNSFLHVAFSIETIIIVLTSIAIYILDYSSYSNIYMIVAISYLLHPLYYYNMYVYMTKDKNMYIVQFTFLAVLSIIIADLILISFFGVIGAAYAQLIYALIISWVSYFYMIKKFSDQSCGINKRMGIYTFVSLAICSCLNMTAFYILFCVGICIASSCYIIKNKSKVFEAIKGDL